MGVERSDDLDTTLASVHFLNLEFPLVIEDAFYGDWLEGPFAFKLVKVLCIRPGEMSLVLRGNIYWGLLEIL